MKHEQLDPIAHVFKVLAKPSRIEVLRELLLGPRTVGELESLCSISPASLAQTINVLKQDGVLGVKSVQNLEFVEIIDERVRSAVRSFFPELDLAQGIPTEVLNQDSVPQRSAKPAPSGSDTLMRILTALNDSDQTD